jgi:hypothetical protein
VIADVSEEPVHRGSSIFAASDPRSSNSRKIKVFLTSYFVWIARRRNITEIIRRFGISFRSHTQVIVFIKPEDGIEKTSRNVVIFLQYYAVSLKQMGYEVSFILAESFLISVVLSVFM